ncbi:type II CAAX prenyl endopeptidase Rce1 family protein [Listeria costaricensis]|uniref:CPBP family glutamic-type intramembrane protease n=1 Tax=Listeria costaricensis TaxID=2026604 RepID=UPI000C068141|nr:CPBP family glutamic-type intramembrane protease [Listeria costaricensis]
MEKLLFKEKPIMKYTILLLVVAVSFFQLTMIGNPLPGMIKQLIFTIFPVMAWFLLDKDSFHALFSRLTLKGTTKAVFWAVAANVIGFAVSFMFVLIVGKNNITGNPVAESAQVWYQWVVNFIQLFGEEILSIAVLLVVYAIFRSYVSNRTATIIGVIVCAIIFALLHLSTYGWNVTQVLSILVVPRIIFNYVFLRAEKKPSIVSSWITHSIYDGIAFLLTAIV